MILGILASAGGGAATAYESIATATGTGSSGVITFSSIPGTYTHLQIRGIARTSAALTLDNTLVNFNGDTASNYTFHNLIGDGSAAVTGGFSARTFGAIYSSETGTSAAANLMGTSVTDILDYASTSKFKTMRAFAGGDNNGAGSVAITSSLWRSTSAITSITLTGNSNFTTSTTFALYGIKAA